MNKKIFVCKTESPYLPTKKKNSMVTSKAYHIIHGDALEDDNRCVEVELHRQSL